MKITTSRPGSRARARLTHILILAAIAAFRIAPAASADIGYSFGPIGNPDNADDVGDIGGVSYTYYIGIYAVTLTQYAAFLNAVAQTDRYSLYNPSMATDLNVAGIKRKGTSGKYTYAVIGSGARPVTYVSWFDAARFCNWLQNGQPAGLGEVAGSTEQGAYTLNGANSGIILKNASAVYWIPTGSEWYKAAYYYPQHWISFDYIPAGYYLYATKSTNPPGNDKKAGTNDANYYNGLYSVTQSSSYSSSQQYLTDVGAFKNSSSWYGPYDLNGDVSQWNDEVFNGNPQTRGAWGGSWSGGASAMESYDTTANSYDPRTGNSTLGFRVASSSATSAPAAAVSAGTQVIKAQTALPAHPGAAARGKK